MVNVIKCSRGHYYDASAFFKCPHCENKNFDTGESSQYRRNVAIYASAYIQEQEGMLQNCIIPDKMTVLKEPLKKRTDSDEKTIGLSFKGKGDYFVTGWLVCISGPDLGHSFNLHYGYNTIGYKRENAVCLIEDTTVAKCIHCSVVYEDRKNQSYLVPEPGADTFLNGTLIDKPSLLNAEDILKIGDTELEFIPFCRGNRRWAKEYLGRQI